MKIFSFIHIEQIITFHVFDFQDNEKKKETTDSSSNLDQFHIKFHRFRLILFLYFYYYDHEHSYALIRNT